MVRSILTSLRNSKPDSELIKFAKGVNKYPENIKELINYLKLV